MHYAVKLLDWGSEDIVTDADTAEGRSSFYKEVTVWNKLNHPNITQVKHNFFDYFPIESLHQ
jgi:hypothetical protein